MYFKLGDEGKFEVHENHAVLSDNMDNIVMPLKRLKLLELYINEFLEEINITGKINQECGGGMSLCVNGDICDVILRNRDKRIVTSIPLSLDSVVTFLKLIPELNYMHSTFKHVEKCWNENDHLNQMGFLQCSECSPYGWEYY